MSYNIAYPNTALAPFIKYYWAVKTTNMEDCPCHEIVPTGLSEMVFHFDDIPSSIERSQSSKQFRKMFCGPSNQLTQVISGAKTDMFAIVFKPHGAKVLLSTPLNELKNQKIPLEFLKLPEVDRLYESLLLSDNFEERIYSIENYLIHRINSKLIYDYKRINDCISKINISKGQLTLKSLEETACLGKKHFERVFSNFTGFNPKQFVKIIRFQSALLNYQLKPNLSMSDLAFLCGYYDVSHFVNDFKSFTNRTPKSFFQTIPIESEYFTY